jgi:hypothetical protein
LQRRLMAADWEHETGEKGEVYFVHFLLCIIDTNPSVSTLGFLGGGKIRGQKPFTTAYCRNLSS